MEHIICPFVDKECICEGNKVCMFYDKIVFSSDKLPHEPCKLKRAVNRILHLEDAEIKRIKEQKPEMPFET